MRGRGLRSCREKDRNGGVFNHRGAFQAPLFVFPPHKGGVHRRNRRAAAAAFQPQQADDDKCAGGRELVEVGEVFENDAGLGEDQAAYGEGGVGARLHACGVRAQSGDAALVEQQGRGARAEAGEVEAADGVGAQIGRRVVPAFRPAG